MIATSCELTADSIISCCESGCMADAYSLLRKYRDDLFFYLYIVVCSACNKLDSKSPAVVQMEANNPTSSRPKNPFQPSLQEDRSSVRSSELTLHAAPGSNLQSLSLFFHSWQIILMISNIHAVTRWHSLNICSFSCLVSLLRSF